MQIAPALDQDTSRQAAHSWTGLQIVAIIGLIGALYSFVLPDLAIEWWTQESSSYGMLIPPTALYLLWMRRHMTLALPVQPDMRGLFLVGGACLIFLLGQSAAEFFLSRISVVFLIAGLTWTFWGRPRLHTMAFPFVLLLTMVPLPVLVYNIVAAPLQLFASLVATDLAQLLGVSVFRDGNIIHLSTMSLGVAEACSGLNSLSSLVVGSLLLGFLESGSMVGRILLTLLSVPLAIAVNVVRVTGTAVLADYRPELATGFYHLFSGWLVFVMGFGLLWLLGKAIFRVAGRQS